MYFTITLGSPTTDMQYNKGPTPFSREAIEGSGNMYEYKSYTLFFLIFGEASEKMNSPYLGRLVKKHPLFRFFSGKSSRDKRPKIQIFPRNWEYAWGPLVHSGEVSGDRE